MSLLYSYDTEVTSGIQILNAVNILEPINIFRFEVNFRFSGDIKDKGTQIIDLRNDGDTGYQLLYIDNTKLQFHIAPNYSFDWEYSFKPNIDYHIEITVSNKSITAFVNGNRLINPSSFPTSWGTLPYGTFNLSIGKQFEPSNGNYNDISEINGVIWGLKIYNHAEALIITPNNIYTKALEETTSGNDPIIDPCVFKANNFIENIYITINNCTYLKVFDHDVSKDPTNTSSYFEDEDQAKYCFLPNKFSRLGDLSSSLFRSISDGKYEFLLRYPNAPENYNINIWKQTADAFNPTFDISGNIDGYEDVAIQMNNRWGTDGTTSISKGLGPYSGTDNKCLLDTMPGHTNWWGGLGQYEPYNRGFPSVDGTIEQHVQLWVRIDNTNYNAYIAIRKDSIYCDEFREE